MPRIKLEITTGFAGCRHVDYIDPPIHWDQLDESSREEWLSEAAEEYLHEICESWAEVVDDE